jgi:hypothetical protein
LDDKKKEIDDLYLLLDEKKRSGLGELKKKSNEIKNLLANHPLKNEEISRIKTEITQGIKMNLVINLSPESFRKKAKTLTKITKPTGI